MGMCWKNAAGSAFSQSARSSSCLSMPVTSTMLLLCVCGGDVYIQERGKVVLYVWQLSTINVKFPFCAGAKMENGATTGGIPPTHVPTHKWLRCCADFTCRGGEGVRVRVPLGEAFGRFTGWCVPGMDSIS